MKVYVPKTVRSNLPAVVFNGKVRRGIHEAFFNPHGAVHVVADNGEDMGLYLHDFMFLSKEDRDEWLKIAHPEIPDVVQPSTLAIALLDAPPFPPKEADEQSSRSSEGVGGEAGASERDSNQRGETE